MAASATQNPVVKSESKSAKKKKSKVTSDESAPSPVPAAQEVAPSNGVSESGEYESPYIKELYKNIRGVNKKITNASRVDNVLAENPNLSLDELVAARKINADQKAQVLKKPQLQASLVQLEEQIAQYKKFDQEYKARSQAEKAEFEKTFTERASKELEEAVSAAKSEGEANAKESLYYHLLTLTQFLKLAAIRRSEEDKADLEESKALEGLLGEVYSGDDSAVNHIMKLVSGASDPIMYQGEPLNFTYNQIKAALAEFAPVEPVVEVEVLEVIDQASEPVEASEYPVQSDPTIVNAGLTELDAPTFANDHAELALESQGIPQNSGFGDGAANAAAEANWDNNNDLSTSQEWVEVPRDATETETGLTSTPAAPSNVQSWADDQPDSPGEVTASPPANPNDGFQEIQRNKGGNRGDSRGNFRGGRGDGRGFFRGGRGRGRGRGGADRGRGGRRSDES